MKASGHLLPPAFNQLMEPSLFGRSILGGHANNPPLLATQARNAECARSFSQLEDHFRVDCRQTGSNPETAYGRRRTPFPRVDKSQLALAEFPTSDRIAFA